MWDRGRASWLADSRSIITAIADQLGRWSELIRAVIEQRTTHLWAVAEVEALGRGGGVIVSAAAGIKRAWLDERDLAELEAPGSLLRGVATPPC